MYVEQIAIEIKFKASVANACDISQNVRFFEVPCDNFFPILFSKNRKIATFFGPLFSNLRFLRKILAIFCLEYLATLFKAYLKVVQGWYLVLDFRDLSRENKVGEASDGCHDDELAQEEEEVHKLVQDDHAQDVPHQERKGVLESDKN